MARAVHVLVLVLAVIVGTGSAFLLPSVDPAAKLSQLRPELASYIKMVENDGGRVKRQGGACLNDIANVRNNQTFVDCQTILDTIYNGNTQAANRTGVGLFCRAKCPEVTVFWYNKLALDCGGPAVDSLTLKLLNQSCYIGPNHEYCAFLWESFTDPSVLPDSIQQCGQDLINTGGTTCPASCKTADHWIIDHLGCCGRALINYETDYDGQTDPFGWDVCNIKEPEYCA